jgi:uncharacterized protein YndB with AHSA1/START domain
MIMATESPSRDITVEAVLPHPPGTVWKALTTSEMIADWLMPNDFEPVKGRRFTLKTKPIGNWDGVVECEVLEIEANRRLVYSWVGGSDANPDYGGKLDSVVAWTLTPVEAGTRLRLVHSGFRSPENDLAFGSMSPGWSRIIERISRTLEGATAAG